MRIVNATPDDKEWVLKLYNACAKQLGIVGSSVWYRYWAGDRKAEQWKVAQPQLGFVHYRVRRDGFRVIYEVASAAPRIGVGEALVREVGLPCLLKTDDLNETALRFYRGLGFKECGRSTSRDGRRRLVSLVAFELHPPSLRYKQLCQSQNTPTPCCPAQKTQKSLHDALVPKSDCSESQLGVLACKSGQKW